MSFGWQSESALLPSKAKPITVDAKSVLALKSIVYREEQKRASADPKLHHRKKNTKVKESKSKDNANEVEDTSAERKAYNALVAKSKIYENMMEGKLSSEGSSLLEVPENTAQSVVSSSSVRMTEGPQVVEAIIFDKPQWQWSKGTEKQVEEYKQQIKSEKSLERLVEAEIAMENEKSKSVDGSARIRTQWQKTLESSARNYLEEVHKETETGREISQSISTGKRTMRDERLELLRQKKQKHLEKEAN